ncbi:MAG: NAD(P)/FAD-dependent oxidoreductase, partial [Rhodospirillales bacterium]|nr:NAD(P)/FAD-dependent oxidoreductase [Rhodospirillales bacterium]
GVEFLYDRIEGYSEAAAQRMPHAWSGGEQHRLLRDQLLAMEDGGIFLIAPPAEPYRCPPGPYERVSMAAYYLKRHKPRSRIVILDAKDSFAKQKLFEDGWLRFYEDMIEWLPAEITGGLAAVDPAAMTVMTEDETFEVAVANIIPPQRAGRIAQAAGLADETGWCPVDPATLASRLQPDIHVLGDAIIAGDMPKSAFAAGSQAKACAMAVRAALTGAEAFPPRFRNTCWSFIAENHAVKVGANYRADADKIAKVESYISAADEDDDRRAATAREAAGWYAATVRDIFGAAPS